MSMSKQIFGSKMDFKSLSCEPVNEQGVVYLFGVLHDSFDLKIEAIQQGFPDCIARRQIARNRWQEVRIEFEYDSKSFKKHKHDIYGADMIVCWRHNWKECPEHIEVVELSSMIKDLDEINKEVKTFKKLSEYNKFCRDMRSQGFSFKDIAKIWNEKKIGPDQNKDSKKVDTKNKNLTEYQKFTQQKIIQGYSMTDAARLWRESKEKR